MALGRRPSDEPGRGSVMRGTWPGPVVVARPVRAGRCRRVSAQSRGDARASGRPAPWPPRTSGSAARPHSSLQREPDDRSDSARRVQPAALDDLEAGPLEHPERPVERARRRDPFTLRHVDRIRLEHLRTVLARVVDRCCQQFAGDPSPARLPPDDETHDRPDRHLVDGREHLGASTSTISGRHPGRTEMPGRQRDRESAAGSRPSRPRW